jgi:probable HAF family extracellular repeat protein
MFLWQNGAMTDLGLPQGFDSCVPSSINNLGQIVGTAEVENGPSAAFVWSSQFGIQLLPTTFSGIGINDAGEIVTADESGIGGSQLFQFTNGSANLQHSFNGTAAGINNHGDVALTMGGPTDYEAALYDPSTSSYTRLGFTSTQLSFAAGINDNSEVLANTISGQSSGGSPISHPYLWDPASGLHDLGIANGSGYAYSINSLGDAVGTFDNYSNSYWSFLYTHGVLIDLNSSLDPVTGLGWNTLVAMQINDHGQIVGSGIHNGVPRAFLLTPITVATRPTITIRSAKMVDGHDLSMTVSVQYPKALPGRWIGFSVSLNGTTINPQTAPRACLVQVSPAAKAAVAQTVTINLANYDGRGSAVNRFTSNIVANLTCQAGALTEATGSTARNLAILLPVVLIPGIDSNPHHVEADGGDGTFPGFEKFLKNHSSALLQSHSLLGSPYTVSADTSSDYPTVYTLQYFQNLENFSEAALDLRILLTGAIAERTYASAVNLVGHSKGCLVARQYLVSNPPVAVSRLIMCAPPNLGSAWAKIYYAVNYSDLWPLWPWERATLLSPYQPANNPELEALNQIQLPAGTTYTIIYSQSYPTPFAVTDLPRLVQVAPGDEVVPAFSALGEIPDINNINQRPTLIPAFSRVPMETLQISGGHLSYLNSDTAVQTAVFNRITNDIP